ncbi:MAG: HisA/HisF-related TIM barrel protein [Ignisphaera sp.]
MELNIVPVVDIMNSVVVHAIAGRRNEYKPLSGSVIAKSSDPAEVLRGFKKLGCIYTYIADLDAIMDRGSNEFTIDLALSYGFTVLADIGRKGLERSDSANLFYVIGTEYLEYPGEVDLLFNRIVSLDIKRGKVMFRNTSVDISQVAEIICSRSPRLVVVLNLDRVGTRLGVDIDSLRIVKSICSDVAVGGGIKGVEDLMLLKELGIRYALVATAIHKGVVDKCVY